MKAKSNDFAVGDDASDFTGKRFLNMHDALKLTSLGKTYFFKLIADGKFPQPVKLGRRSAWPEAEVLRWMQERIRERDAVRFRSGRRQKSKPPT